MEIINEETVATKELISKLTDSGMFVERIGEDAYNVISNVTGAVLERLITAADLVRYQRGIDYITVRHGKDITGFKYSRPAHSV